MNPDRTISRINHEIKERTLSIAVVGLGYVGLPTAISFHDAGFDVYGIDVSEELLKSLRDGKSPITDEMGIQIPKGDRWELTSNYASSIPKCDIAIVCVPTPVDENLRPNLDYVTSSINSIVNSVESDGSLIIILESTVQPGTTSKRCPEHINQL